MIAGHGTIDSATLIAPQHKFLFRFYNADQSFSESDQSGIDCAMQWDSNRPGPPSNFCTYTHSHPHTYTHSHTHTYTNSHTPTHTHTHTHTPTHTHTHTPTHTHIHPLTHTYTHRHTI